MRRRASYDTGSNLTSLTPSGKWAHGFSYQAGDLESDYTPSAVDGSGTGHVHTDQQVSLVAADGIPAATVPTCDTVKGRLTSLAFSGGTDTVRVRSRERAGELDRHVRRNQPELHLRRPAPQDDHLGGIRRGQRHPHLRYGLPPRQRDGRGRPPVSFQYDNDGLLTSAGALSITRDPATGFVTSSTLGSTTETRTSNSYGEEQSYTVKFGTTVLYSVDYGTRDEFGNVLSDTAPGSQPFGFAGGSRDRDVSLTNSRRETTIC